VERREEEGDGTRKEERLGSKEEHLRQTGERRGPRTSRQQYPLERTPTLAFPHCSTPPPPSNRTARSPAITTCFPLHA
jgi:hypothetical protein